MNMKIFVLAGLSLASMIISMEANAQTVVSKMDARYPDQSACIKNAKFTVGFISGPAMSGSLSNIITNEFKNINAYVSQTFYTESGRSLMSMIVCNVDGSSQTTSFLVN